MISTRMSELQKPLKNTDVHLVSVSVDPEHDTPEILRGYAEKLQAQPQRWDFLTGSKQAIYNLFRNGFKLAIADGLTKTGSPVHSTRVILVDRRGEIRGYYDALAPDAITKLLADTITFCANSLNKMLPGIPALLERLKAHHNRARGRSAEIVADLRLRSVIESSVGTSRRRSYNLTSTRQVSFPLI